MSFEKGKWRRTYTWHGVTKTVVCGNHVYAWSGRIPNTGEQKCIFCGRPKNLKHHPNLNPRRK